MKKYSFFVFCFFLVGFGCSILQQFHHSVTEARLLPHHRITSHHFPGLSRPSRYLDREAALTAVCRHSGGAAGKLVGSSVTLS